MDAAPKFKWDTSYGKKPKKYRQGDHFATFQDLVDWIDAGGWVYGWNHKRPIHPGFVLSQQLQFLLHGFHKFHRAVETDEWKAWNRSKFKESRDRRARLDRFDEELHNEEIR